MKPIHVIIGVLSGFPAGYFLCGLLLRTIGLSAGLVLALGCMIGIFCWVTAWQLIQSEKPLELIEPSDFDDEGWSRWS